MNLLTCTIEDIPLDITYNYIPGSPGYTTGLPENCYPDEPGEIEIIEIFLNEIDIYALLIENEKIISEIENQIYKYENDKDFDNYDNF